MSPDFTHLTTAELGAGLDEIRRSPRDEGVLALIVRRPQIGDREVLERGALDLAEGLVGDSWSRRGSGRSADGGPHPDMQLNVMNARAAALGPDPYVLERNDGQPQRYGEPFQFWPRETVGLLVEQRRQHRLIGHDVIEVQVQRAARSASPRGMLTAS